MRKCWLLLATRECGHMFAAMLVQARTPGNVWCLLLQLPHCSFNGLLTSQHKVVGLDVAVADAARVAVLQELQHAAHDGGSLLLAQLALLSLQEHAATHKCVVCTGILGIVCTVL